MRAGIINFDGADGAKERTIGFTKPRATASAPAAKPNANVMDWGVLSGPGNEPAPIDPAVEAAAQARAAEMKANTPVDAQYNANIKADLDRFRAGQVQPNMVPTYTDESGKQAPIPANITYTSDTTGQSILSPLMPVIKPVAEVAKQTLGPVAQAPIDFVQQRIKDLQTLGGDISSIFSAGSAGGGAPMTAQAINTQAGKPAGITQADINAALQGLSGFNPNKPQDVTSRYIGTQDQTVHTLQDLVNQQNLAKIQDSRYMDSQANALSNLARSASGAGPSPAQLMLMAQNDANTRQSMALAASQTGRALPAVQRQIMEQAALGGQQAAQQSAILRAQEMLAAQNDYAAAVQGARGQDITMADMVAKQNQFQSAQKLTAAQAAAQSAATARTQDMETAKANIAASQNTDQMRLQAAQAAASTRAALMGSERNAQTSEYSTGVGAQTDAAKIQAQLQIAAMQDATARQEAANKLKAAAIGGILSGGSSAIASIYGGK